MSKTTKRGETVVASSGAVGLFVGKRGGLVWICYEAERFAAMCQAFDKAR